MFFRTASKNGLVGVAYITAEELLASSLPEIARIALKASGAGGVLALHGACFNRCLFCGEYLQPAITEDLHKRDLERLSERIGPTAPETMLITGTEPLTHPKLFRYLELLKQKGMKRFHLLTSGTALFAPSLVAQLVSFGLESVSIPMYSDRAEEHDSIVGIKGAMKSLMQGISALRIKGVNIFVHTLALAQNVYRIDALSAFVRQEVGSELIVYPLIMRRSLEIYKSFAISFTELKHHLRLATVAYFPLCLGLPSYERKYLLTGRLYRSADVSVAPPSLVFFGMFKRIKDPMCSRCRFYETCVGIQPEHITVYEQECSVLKPQKKR